MSLPPIQNLPASVIEKLGFYVYLLLDPRTNKVFYVGRGTGNRVLAHIYEAGLETDPSEKLDIIREIHNEGLDVQHIILRHGLTQKEAIEVEAALIDYIDLETLSNQVRGYHSFDRGRMTLAHAIAEYNAPEISIFEPSILITVNKLYRSYISEEGLYDITRGNWVIGTRRHKAKFAFSIYNGIIRAVYEIEGWHPVKARREDQKTQNRWRFDGKPAESMKNYIGHSVKQYLKIGAQNPIKYINC
jgi:uncharacterized protein